MSKQEWVSPVVAVGVSGHRTLAEPEQLRAAIDQILHLISRAANVALATGGLGGEQFTLRIVSPVAEGADRLVAQAGLDLGAALQCPLPLPRDNYEKDFKTVDSRVVYRGFLDRAERVFELDDTGPRDDAYLAVGRLVLSQSDLLIAIWDGKQARGRGGTGEIVAEALARHTPVIWLRPDMAEAPIVISGSIGNLVHHELATLNEIVARLVAPPKPHIEEDEHGPKWSTNPANFLAEKPNPLWILAGGFNAFVNLILGRFPWPRFNRGHWLAESRGYWAAPYEGHDPVQTSCQPCLQERISIPFARADALATQYAGLYRTTFLVNFALSAFAVGCAIYTATTPKTEVKIATFLELGSIAGIIGLTWLANARHYHERWVDYRHLAEQIRPLRFLFPLGLALPQPRPSQFQEQGAANSWTEWLVRRLERELGLPDVVLTPAYLNSVHDFATSAILQEQIDYHGRNRDKLAEVDHRLHIIGVLFFALTAIACGLDVFSHTTENVLGQLGLSRELVKVSLFRASGILPALGAAVLGVRNIGEFARLELRSKGMEAALEETKANLTRPPEEDQQRVVLSGHLEALAIQMMAETADWRTLVITRHIELPA